MKGIARCNLCQIDDSSKFKVESKITTFRKIP